MKKIFCIFLLSALYFTGNTQTRGRVSSSSPSGLSVGLDAGVPIGDNGRPYSFIIGGDLQYETKPATDVGITFSGGYLHFPIKTSYGSGSIGFVPLLAGIKYYFIPDAFFHAQLGAAVGTGRGQGTSFAYSPGLGAKLSKNVDAELRFMGISNKAGSIDNVGLRLGYNF